MLAYCQNALSHVSLTHISQRDVAKIKATGCYVHYRPVINVAKMVLNEISIGATGNSECTSYVVPYAISMSKLFEMYVRAYLKKSGIKSYLSDEPGLHILKYDYKAKVLVNSASNSSNYIGGNIKPDIILFDTATQKYTVFDVKYKRLSDSRYARTDRLQLLAYALMFDCDNIGIIFPTTDGGISSFYERNQIQSQEKRDRYYHQLEFSIDKSWSFDLQSKDKSSQTRLLSYFNALNEEPDKT